MEIYEAIVSATVEAMEAMWQRLIDLANEPGMEGISGRAALRALAEGMRKGIDQEMMILERIRKSR